MNSNFKEGFTKVTCHCKLQGLIIVLDKCIPFVTEALFALHVDVTPLGSENKYM